VIQITKSKFVLAARGVQLENGVTSPCILISRDNKLCQIYYENIIENEAHFLSERPLYKSIKDGFPAPVQNVVLGRLECWLPSDWTIKLILASILHRSLHCLVLGKLFFWHHCHVLLVSKAFWFPGLQNQFHSTPYEYNSVITFSLHWQEFQQLFKVSMWYYLVTFLINTPLHLIGVCFNKKEKTNTTKTHV
jgi:hypothetical protein